jgi:DNA-binding NarL/FixJ family response regulator
VPSTKPCVFLVAESQLLRETLAKFINKKGNLNVCGVSPIVPSISYMVAASGADVLILDSTSARNSDYKILHTIIGVVPNINVVLIDMDDHPEILLKFVRARALAYLSKDAAAANVLSAILAVARGQAVCSPRLVYFDPFRSNPKLFDVQKALQTCCDARSEIARTQQD